MICTWVYEIDAKQLLLPSPFLALAGFLRFVLPPFSVLLCFLDSRHAGCALVVRMSVSWCTPCFSRPYLRIGFVPTMGRFNLILLFVEQFVKDWTRICEGSDCLSEQVE